LKAVKKMLSRCRLFTSLQTKSQQRRLAVAKSVLRTISTVNLTPHQFEEIFSFGVNKSTLRETNDQYNKGAPKKLMAQVFRKAIPENMKE